MILQVGLTVGLGVSELIEFGGTLLRETGGPDLSIFPGGTFTLGGFFRQAIARPFRRRSPRLGSFQRGEVLKALQLAKITRDPIVRVADPFLPQTLGIFRESQRALAPQLFLEAALRREAARQPPVFREVRPDFSRERVSEIQAFFQSLPTAEERAQRGLRAPPPPGSKRFRSAIASGIRQR